MSCSLQRQLDSCCHSWVVGSLEVQQQRSVQSEPGAAWISRSSAELKEVFCAAHLFHSDRRASSPRMLFLDQLAYSLTVQCSLSQRRIIIHSRGHQAT
ncbi:hypothetical protein ATANTOWER_006561 [Ataeniobius toweri]|uniref:Uncharacterized protein n=1 Tax=Ataeniobius toweri TaxID=208326 RepID=A0ABU7BE61_9TELE|nr:hypothetical protein [Ataeniobius toweri]